MDAAPDIGPFPLQNLICENPLVYLKESFAAVSDLLLKVSNNNKKYNLSQKKVGVVNMRMTL